MIQCFNSFKVKSPLLVVGIDGASYDILMNNLHRLPTITSMLDRGYSISKIFVDFNPVHSAPCWTTIFSGVRPEKHEHLNFFKMSWYGKIKVLRRLVKPKLLTRKDIPVKFIWDELSEEGYKAYALNIPFVYPPYSFGVNFKGSHYGLGLTEDELLKEVHELTSKAAQLLKTKTEFLALVYTQVEKIQHLHWGNPDKVLKWYEIIDGAIAKLLENHHGEVIVLSDHGFTDWGKSDCKTLPHVTKNGVIIKGDHAREAILIAKISHKIKALNELKPFMRRLLSC